MAELSVEIKIAAYFLLVSFTSKGRNQTDQQIAYEQDKITKLIRDFPPPGHGNCELFLVPGPYDFISKVWGVTEAEAIQIQLQIESGGNVKALLLPGVKVGNNK